MVPLFGFYKGLVVVLWGVVWLEGRSLWFVIIKTYWYGIFKGVGVWMIFKKWRKSQNLLSWVYVWGCGGKREVCGFVRGAWDHDELLKILRLFFEINIYCFSRSSDFLRFWQTIYRSRWPFSTALFIFCDHFLRLRSNFSIEI